MAAAVVGEASLSARPVASDDAQGLAMIDDRARAGRPRAAGTETAADRKVAWGIVVRRQRARIAAEARQVADDLLGRVGTPNSFFASDPHSRANAAAEATPALVGHGAVVTDARHVRIVGAKRWCGDPSALLRKGERDAIDAGLRAVAPTVLDAGAALGDHDGRVEVARAVAAVGGAWSVRILLRKDLFGGGPAASLH